MKYLLLLVSTVWLLLPCGVRAQKDTAHSQELLQLLAQGRRQVIPDLVKQGEKVLGELVKLLKSSQDEEKALVTETISEIARKIGPKAREAIPALCDTLASRNKSVADLAASALGAIGPDVVPTLVKTLNARQMEASALYAVRALDRIGKGTKNAVPALLSTLETNADAQIRLACIEALGSAGSEGKDAVIVLVKIAESDKKASYYQAQILVTLGKIGPEAKAAIPFLGRTIKEAPEPHIRLHALEALARINPATKDLNEAFLGMLESSDIPRLLVLENLSKEGLLTKDALKIMEELLRDKDRQVRLQAAILYGNANPNHAAVVSILIESLNEKDARIRQRAAEAIGSLRPSDESVLEALNKHQHDMDPETRKAVAAALSKFKKK